MPAVLTNLSEDNIRLIGLSLLTIAAATTPAAPQFNSYPKGYGGYVIQTLWPAAEMRNLVFVLMGVATGVLVRVATRVLVRRWSLWRGGKK